MNELLAHPWTGDGLTLPAGTDVSWSAANNPPDDPVTLNLRTGILTANEMADGSAFEGKVITRCRLR